MAYKCAWCKDTGKYYPLQGPAEPCRECAAFAATPRVQTIGAISVSQIAQTLMVMDLTPEQCDIIRDNIPYSGQGFDVCRRTAYIATWKEHVPQILDLLGWNVLDTRMYIDGEHWIMEHKPKDTSGIAVKDTRCTAEMNGERCLFNAVPNQRQCRFHVDYSLLNPNALCRP